MPDTLSSAFGLLKITHMRMHECSRFCKDTALKSMCVNLELSNM